MKGSTVLDKRDELATIVSIAWLSAVSIEGHMGEVDGHPEAMILWLLVVKELWSEAANSSGSIYIAELPKFTFGIEFDEADSLKPLGLLAGSDWTSPTVKPIIIRIVADEKIILRRMFKLYADKYHIIAELNCLRLFVCAAIGSLVHATKLFLSIVKLSI